MNTFLNENNEFNYVYLKSFTAIVNQVIETEEQYIQWVSNWKIVHRDLVNKIQLMRKLKWQAKTGAEKVQYWIVKKQLGSLARTMYRVRVDNKAALKQGAYQLREAA